MTRPLRTITEQIKDLSEGEIDLSKQIYVDSKDEIGKLSSSFNMLLQSIHDINVFKKVIEEDETLEDVYVRLAKVFKERLELNFILFEVSNSKNTMRAVATPFSGEEICCNKEILINCNLCRAKRTGHTVSSISYPGLCRQFLRGEDMYHICIPMVMGDGTGGVVQILVDKAKPVDIQEIDKKVIKAQQYIKEAVPVIETKRLTAFLKESSVRDQMTGLYNRRFLEEYVDTLVAGVTRKKDIVGLLMCDLDFFKEVNDRFGHDVGDMVLKETAKAISKNARASDMVIRFGGEEFLLVLINGKEGEAMEVAERIRKSIEGLRMRAGGAVIQKTISIGVSEFPLDTHNFWKAIKYADIALYKAKETGRNRVVRFTKDMWTEEEY
jgi:diguanylate cyclase (GGDEF)-like protein